MSSLANLAPIPTRKSFIQKDLNGSDDEFDAMLGDMLDSPSAKEPSRSSKEHSKSSKQKSSSSNRGQKKKYIDDDSLDNTQESISFPSNTKAIPRIPSPPPVPLPSQDSGFGRKVGKNILDDSNDLSMDSDNGLLMNITANTDDLEDSILGGLLKSKTRSTKQALKPGNAASSSSKLSSSSRNTKANNQSDISPTSNNDSDDSDNHNVFKYDSRGKDKRGSTTVSATVGETTKDVTSKFNYGSDEISDEDEEEEESGYQPSVAVRKPNQNQNKFQDQDRNQNQFQHQGPAPHPPSLSLHPSSSNHHSTVDSHSSVSKNVPEVHKNVPEGHGHKSEGNTWGSDERGNEKEKETETKRGGWSGETDRDAKNKDTDDVDIGFVPSFLEPGRQPRQKRNLGGPVGSLSQASTGLSSGMGSKVSDSLDELDLAMGFGSSVASKQSAAGNKVVADPFLNAGSISSGTSLGGRYNTGDKPRIQVDSSDSEDDRPVKTNPNPTKSSASTLGFAPSLGSPHGAGATGGSSGLFPKGTIGTNESPVSLTSVALPSLSLSRSPSSQYGDRGSNFLKFSVNVEEEDELDVSGIVRKQSDEDFMAGDKEKSDKEKYFEKEKSDKYGDNKRTYNTSSSSSSSGGGGSNGVGGGSRAGGEPFSLSVDTRSPPYSQKRSGSYQEGSSGLSGLSGSPSNTRRDKIVSFDSSSPRATPAKGLSGLSGLSVGESSHYDQTTPRAAAGVSSGPTTPTSASSSAQIFKLQHRLEEANLQRDATERIMRLEVESLKARLLSQDGWGSSNSNNNNNNSNSNQMQEMQSEHEKIRSKLLDELNDLRRRVSQLEGEVARHTDEAIIQGLKHREEIKYLQDRREGEISDIERRKDDEVKCIERRHLDAVCALKQVHVDELQAVRERARDGVALNQLAGQMKQTSGSIKLLEENLNARYKGLDAAKEGQLEARERLLAEMEQKARERVEAAEVESYRLKGLLVHMEHVAGTLRGQGGEETERLRQEHHRLQVMQTSLESERVAIQARASEETAALRQKARDLEAEARRALEERRSHESVQAAERLKIDADRADFAAHVTSASRAAEAGANQLKEEEARLKRVREDLAEQKAQFEKKKQTAMIDIQAAEQVKRSISAAKEELARERLQIERLARDFQVASERLSLKGEALEVAERALAEREGVLLDGIAHMQSEAVVLSRREADVRDSARVVDFNRASMEDQDRALTHKRIEAAAIQRALSGRQAAATITSLLAPDPTDYSSRSHGPSPRSQLEGTQGSHQGAQGSNHSPYQGTQGPHKGSQGSYQGPQGPQSNQNVPPGNEESGAGSGAGSAAGSGTSDLLSQLRSRGLINGANGPVKASLSPAERQRKALEDQALSSAKQVLQNVRGQLSRSSGDRLEMNRFIEEESAFLGNVKKRAFQ